MNGDSTPKIYSEIFQCWKCGKDVKIIHIKIDQNHVAKLVY
jgi:hypothetical protein